MKDHEHKLQTACVTWFRYSYSKYRLLLFAIPNGGFRHFKIAKELKAEGVIQGVADLFLSVPQKDYVFEEHTYNGLYIEMKIHPNKQTENQKQFQREVEEQGYKYAVCYGFDEFRNLIDDYLKFCIP